MSSVVGNVSAIFRYPVKSMLGESLDEVDVEVGGLSRDRAFALLDVETGKVVSVKRPKRWSRIFELQAFTEDGTWVRFPAGDLEKIQTIYFRQHQIEQDQIWRQVC